MNEKKIEAIYPLSPLQQGMLFHSIDAPHSGVYLQQVIVTLRGELNTAAMVQSWQFILDRHPALRTVFVWEHEDRPFQAVLSGALLLWEQLDWRSLPVND